MYKINMAKDIINLIIIHLLKNELLSQKCPWTDKSTNRAACVPVQHEIHHTSWSH